MLTESIEYLKKSDDVWKTSIIGGLLLLFSFLLIPLFLVWGYIVRVLDRTAHGDDEAPVFDDWGEMTVDGAKASVIVLAYSLVPFVVGAALFGGIWASVGGNFGTGSAVAMVVSGLLVFALFIAAAYVTPAALANYAETGRIGSGFDFEALRPSLSSGTYASGWLIALGILVVASFVSGILNAIPFVGTVLGAIVAFYALVAAYYVIGQTWEKLHSVSVDGRNGDLSSDQPAV